METKRKITPVAAIAMAAIAVVSFANFFGLTIGEEIGFAGLAIIIGLAAFFIVKAIERQPFGGSGFDIRAIPENLKSVKNWFWMLSPIIWGAITLPIILNLVPEAAVFDQGRAASYVNFDNIATAIVMLFVLALGEEIGMRSFLQNQLSRIMPVPPAIILTSVLFTVGHYTPGDMVSVIVNLISVFALSILYGIVFYKTNNGWISGIAHFLSNFFVIFVYGATSISF